MFERGCFVQLYQSGIGRLDIDEGSVSPLFEAGGYVNLPSLPLGCPEPSIRARPVVWDLVDTVIEEFAGHSRMQLPSCQLLVNLKPAHEAQTDWI